MTEAAGARDEAWRLRLLPAARRRPRASRVPFDPADPPQGSQNFQVLDFERQASFFMTGGLVAVHADGPRPRRDLGRAAAPRGLRHQRPAHPALVRPAERARPGPRRWAARCARGDAALPGARGRLASSSSRAARTGRATRSAPSASSGSAAASATTRRDERRRITRVEVVRIRPQSRPGEPVAPLIEDPWRAFPCPPDGDGCIGRVRRPGLRRRRPRHRLLRARAPGADAGGQRRQPALPLRRRRAAASRCDACYGDYRTPVDDDCLAPSAERAWSSPIFVRR